LSSDYPSSRVFFNILGGSLTLLSVQLPWIRIYGVYPVSLQSSGLYAVVFYWALAGAVLSFLSRYGGVMTLVGMIGLLGEPYTIVGSASVGLGLLLAFGGAIFTFAGVKWSVPGGLMRRREVVGGLLYSVGFLIVLTLLVSSDISSGLLSGLSGLIVTAPLLLVGVLLTGLGLKLFLSVDRRDSLSVLSDNA
jgi:hypothetical protein